MYLLFYDINRIKALFYKGDVNHSFQSHRDGWYSPNIYHRCLLLFPSISTLYSVPIITIQIGKEGFQLVVFVVSVTDTPYAWISRYRLSFLKYLQTAYSTRRPGKNAYQ